MEIFTYVFFKILTVFFPVISVKVYDSFFAIDKK